MSPDNPACYECPKGKDNLHTWKMINLTQAQCVKCKLLLTPIQTREVQEDNS